MNFFCIVPILKYEIETILKIHILINKKIKIIKTYIVSLTYRFVSSNKILNSKYAKETLIDSLGIVRNNKFPKVKDVTSERIRLIYFSRSNLELYC